jgi:hypothetical protein
MAPKVTAKPAPSSAKKKAKPVKKNNNNNRDDGEIDEEESDEDQNTEQDAGQTRRSSRLAGQVILSRYFGRIICSFTRV